MITLINRANKRMLAICCFMLPFLELNAQGADLFKTNCTACHRLGSKLIGPDLIGVNERRSEDWLIKFIQSSQSVINSGDEAAVALFAEFNNMPMPDQPFSDDEVKSILAYISENSPQGTDDQIAEAIEPVEVVPFTYTPEDVEKGRALFSGETRFLNGGASCLSCHNVTDDQLLPGGLLAKDLTQVYTRMGDAGINGILNAPPFPAMTEAYNNSEITEDEAKSITAFLVEADKTSGTQTAKSGFDLFLGGGGAGMLLILVIVGVHWRGRKKGIVNGRIFERQIKAQDAKF